MAALNVQEIELGFVEKPEDPSLLESPFFPSKVGGKPAWLDLGTLPSPDKLACISCGKPSVFLLQIYAPLAHLNPQAFHRSIFIFMCRDPSCHQNMGRRVFKVFRLQLPKTSNCKSEKNLATEGMPETTQCHGSQDSSLEEVSVGTVQTEAAATSAQECSVSDKVKPKASPSNKPHETPPLCVVCGCLGPKKCGKCKRANYCSREHQIHDWKSGHKLYCSDLAAGKCYEESDMQYVPSAGVLLPEFEIVTETEPEQPEEEERSENERMEDYLKFVMSGKYKEVSVGDKAEKVMEKAKSDLTCDKYFKAFKKRVAIEPEQVLRYQRGGQPLLVSGDDIPRATDIPKCNCGADRVFEFQVMPQLLYYLKLDSLSGHSIDWGTLVVYTCTASCTFTGDMYKEEFIWKQDFST